MDEDFQMTQQTVDFLDMNKNIEATRSACFRASIFELCLSFCGLASLNLSTVLIVLYKVNRSFDYKMSQ